MKPLYFKFENESKMAEFLISNGFVRDKQTNEWFCSDKYLDIIGIIPGKATYDNQGNILSQDPDLPGWHVNLLVPDDYSLQQPGVAVTVTTPVRKWAGY